MCGFVATNRALTDLDSVARYLRHRGPDGTRRIDRHGFTFVHYLLSITGERTDQPLEEDGLVCLFNGEIYNYRELSSVAPGSDGHILIPLYREGGPQVFSQLDGEFAIALFDFHREQLIVATDPFATKPLWLARGDGDLGVASYASSLLALGFEGRDILQVGPNQVRVLDLREGQEIHRLRLVDFRPDAQHKRSYDDWTRAFQAAVRKRTAGTRENIFLALSSGYDSGALACELQAQGVSFHAYSIAAEEDLEVLEARHDLVPHGDLFHFTRRQFHDARQILKERCEEYRYQIVRSGCVTPDEYLTDDKGAVGLSFIAQLAQREGCRIHLSGQGADEVLSDYGSAGEPIFDHSTLAGHFPPDLEACFPWRNLFASTQQAYLAKEEHVTGSFGLEGRYPYLDRDLVQEFLWLHQDLKNRHYKAPLHAYLSLHGYPFAEGVKVGFRCQSNLL